MFLTNDARRRRGGSAYIELQYCELPQGTSLSKLVSVDAIQNWKQSSLYVYLDDDDIFYHEYSALFGLCICADLQERPIDLHGINYIAPSKVSAIVQRIRENKPKDYQVMLAWLEAGTVQNGFYLLGL